MSECRACNCGSRRKDLDMSCTTPAAMPSCCSVSTAARSVRAAHQRDSATLARLRIGGVEPLGLRERPPLIGCLEGDGDPAILALCRVHALVEDARIGIAHARRGCAAAR